MQTEQQAIYTILIDGSLATSTILTPQDFAVKTHQIIFDAILKLTAESKPVDIVTVAERIEDDHGQVDMGYLGKLLESGVGAPQNFKTYESYIKKDARDRRAREIAERLSIGIQEKLPGDHVSEAIRSLMELDLTSRSYDHDHKDMLREALEGVQAASEKDGLTGITTGIRDLDDAIGGYHDSDLIVIPARPAMGKTAFLLSSLLRSARKGVIPGTISAEQNIQQMGQRLICIDGSISSQHMRTAKLDADEWNSLDKSVIRLQQLKGRVNDKAGITINEVISQARKWKHEHGINILFVDYIQKIEGADPYADRTKQVTYNVRALKNLAKELNIPVVALAQLNRECERRQDKRPVVSDIADASEIEKEADVIMTLYRDEVYNESTQYPGTAELNLVKNRHGPTGCIYCRYVGKHFQFRDINEGAA